jgi:hypothetical protein
MACGAETSTFALKEAQPMADSLLLNPKSCYPLCCAGRDSLGS